MKQNHKLEPLIAVFGPGGRSGKRAHDQAREEFAFVLRGEVTLTLADEENVLRPGDAVTLPARAPRLLGEPHERDRGGPDDLVALSAFSTPLDVIDSSSLR